MLPVVRSVVGAAGCPCLAAQGNVVSYYLGPRVSSTAIVGPFFFDRWDAQQHRVLSGIPAYQWAIRGHYFHVVEIDPAENPRLFGPVVSALASTPGYRLAASFPIPGWGRSRIEVWWLPHDPERQPGGSR
jgi:hypothetical protein